MSVSSAMQRLALASYPPSFRSRYGDELAALCEDAGPSARSVVDLVRGSSRAWFSPVYGADATQRRRGRLLSTASTLWVCFCVVLVGTLGTLRLLEDPPAPGLGLGSPRWVEAHDVAATAVVVGTLLVVAVGLRLGLQVLRTPGPARRVVRGPVLALVVVGASFVPLQWYAAAHPAQPRDPAQAHVAAWFALVGLAWALAVAATAAWWTLAMPYALRLSAPADASLRLPAIVGVPLALALLVPAGLLVAVCVSTGSVWGPFWTVVGAGCVLAVVLAALVACLSAARGVRALLTA